MHTVEGERPHTGTGHTHGSVPFLPPFPGLASYTRSRHCSQRVDYDAFSTLWDNVSTQRIRLGMQALAALPCKANWHMPDEFDAMGKRKTEFLVVQLPKKETPRELSFQLLSQTGFYLYARGGVWWRDARDAPHAHATVGHLSAFLLPFPGRRRASMQSREGCM